MKIVFMGTPEFAVPVLEGLINKYEVVLVVSQPDKKVGRHQILTNTPIKEVALKHNIKVLQPNNIRKEYTEILAAKPDLIVTCAYGQIIPKKILDYPQYGCINVHASLLPRFRGGAPIHKAIIEGDKKTGITIMYMDVSMDTGDIIAQKEIEILDSDDLESVHDKLSVLGKELLLETLPSVFNKTNKRIKQNNKEATYAYNIKREEEHIDFSKNSLEIFNLIRGLCPSPGSYAILDEKEMKIYKSYVLEGEKFSGEYGEIVDINKEGIVVKTKDGAIVITDIKPFGKKRMAAKAYINGSVKDKLIGKVFK